MKHAFTTGSSLVALAAFTVALPARAANWYVSPTGTATTGCTTRSTPCSLSSAASAAAAGDTVYLMSGVYHEQLVVANTGTAAAPITFKADDCATPIIESATSTDSSQATGVYSETGEYLHFEGLVVRGWTTGFGNAWAGGTDSSAVSNGNWQIKNCISYSNGRTGFTFFSASNYQLMNSISAHNGTSTAHSWSSGVTLFEATGTNLIQGVVSFENTDEEKHTDGSGFIVDEGTNGATFLNNIAFGNSGSCFRLTKSSGTTFVNNTCYHNSQFGSQATGPSNPGELYFTNGGVTLQNVNFKNNVIVGTGTAPAGSTAVQNQPTSGWSNNLVQTGAAPFFTAPDGTNPDFTLVASATDLIGKGGTGTGVPTSDIGLDPKCLVKRTPTMYGTVPALGRWQYDIDVDYVTAKGGVAKCFNAGARSGTPDIGAYKAGAVTIAPATCTQGMGGGNNGSAGAGGTSSGSGGSGGGVASAGDTGSAGAAGSAGASGTASTTAGAFGNGGSAGVLGAGANAGTVPNGGSQASAGNASNPTGANSGGTAGDSGGCGCRTASRDGKSHSLAALGLLGLAAIGLKRRRAGRA